MKKRMAILTAQHNAVVSVALGAAQIISDRLIQVLLPLLTIVGGFVLWRGVLATPTYEQLLGLGLYGAFIVLPILAVSRRK